jgi:hypothetical protein
MTIASFRVQKSSIKWLLRLLQVLCVIDPIKSLLDFGSTATI